MTLSYYSRFQFGFARFDEDGNEYLTEHSPFRFQDEPDNRPHSIKQGDTVFNLAGRYLRGVDSERACGLWWIIADFNDIHDPTLALTPGRVLAIPSTRLVNETILAESRRREQ